jgi:hypothetical protein
MSAAPLATILALRPMKGDDMTRFLTFAAVLAMTLAVGPAGWHSGEYLPEHGTNFGRAPAGGAKAVTDAYGVEMPGDAYADAHGVQSPGGEGSGEE